VGTHRRRCDGAAPVRRAGSRCTLSADSAAWLASLQSVADAYGRAEAAARADEAREAVRLRRAARDDGRAAAAALLDRDRARLLACCYTNKSSCVDPPISVHCMMLLTARTRPVAVQRTYPSTAWLGPPNLAGPQIVAKR